jgi:hypothetical protein
MTLPFPTLDHVVVNVRHRMDEAAARYCRLGFTLTPRGHHTLGSMNHLAIFGTDYLELIGAEAGNEKRRDILEWPTGLNGLVFGTEDSASVHAALTEAGVASSPPTEFSRPVELREGTRPAVFRTVRLPNETVPAGRLYFCHHFTRDLVWRDEWRLHANGVIGVLRATIAAERPEMFGSLFRRMFGDDAVVPIEGGVRLLVGVTDFDVIVPDVLAARYGEAAVAGEGRESWMAALTLRTRSLARAHAALRDGRIDMHVRPGLIVVPPGDAMGVTLEFVE